MIGKETLEKKPITLAHVKKILEARKDAISKEPTYEQTQTLEYVNSFARISPDTAESLFNNLLNMENMTEEAAVKIVDLFPEDVEALKLILPKGAKIEEAQHAEIVELLSKHKAKTPA